MRRLLAVQGVDDEMNWHLNSSSDHICRLSGIIRIVLGIAVLSYIFHKGRSSYE